jgi:hypothetical protein
MSDEAQGPGTKSGSVERQAPVSGWADSLKLATVNAAIAVTVRALEATHVYQGDLVAGAGACFVAPTLGLLALAFSHRDITRGHGRGVMFAALLTLLALGASWWPLLEAD